jgi:hypothetical protein
MSLIPVVGSVTASRANNPILLFGKPKMLYTTFLIRMLPGKINQVHVEKFLHKNNHIGMLTDNHIIYIM